MDGINELLATYSWQYNVSWHLTFTIYNVYNIAHINKQEDSFHLSLSRRNKHYESVNSDWQQRSPGANKNGQVNLDIWHPVHGSRCLRNCKPGYARLDYNRRRRFVHFPLFCNTWQIRVRLRRYEAWADVDMHDPVQPPSSLFHPWFATRMAIGIGMHLCRMHLYHYDYNIAGFVALGQECGAVRQMGRIYSKYEI